MHASPLPLRAVVASALLVAISAACTSPRADPVEPVVAADGSFAGDVDASCAGCGFGVAGEGCELAVQIDGRVLLVDGTGIDEHGDAHAADGFCNAVRRARVRGRVVGDRFVAEVFELLPAGTR